MYLIHVTNNGRFLYGAEIEGNLLRVILSVPVFFCLGVFSGVSSYIVFNSDLSVILHGTIGFLYTFYASYDLEDKKYIYIFKV